MTDGPGFFLKLPIFLQPSALFVLWTIFTLSSATLLRWITGKLDDSRTNLKEVQEKRWSLMARLTPDSLFILKEIFLLIFHRKLVILCIASFPIYLSLQVMGPIIYTSPCRNGTSEAICIYTLAITIFSLFEGRIKILDFLIFSEQNGSFLILRGC